MIFLFWSFSITQIHPSLLHWKILHFYSKISGYTFWFCIFGTYIFDFFVIIIINISWSMVFKIHTHFFLSIKGIDRYVFEQNPLIQQLWWIIILSCILLLYIFDIFSLSFCILDISYSVTLDQGHFYFYSSLKFTTFIHFIDTVSLVNTYASLLYIWV